MLILCRRDLRVLAELPFCVSLSSKDQAEMDPADMEDVEEVEEEETGEDENSKGQSPFKDAPLLRVRLKMDLTQEYIWP